MEAAKIASRPGVGLLMRERLVLLAFEGVRVGDLVGLVGRDEGEGGGGVGVVVRGGRGGVGGILR